MSFLCAKCGQECEEDEYKLHIRNDCTTLRCPKCPQFFPNAEALIKHTKAVHDKPFQCTICQVGFACKYNLQRHQLCTHKQIYNEKKAQKCETCGEVFVGKYFLKLHIRSAHKKDFVCHVCKDEFVSVYTLRKHMQRRHQDVDVGIDGQKINRAVKVECPKCGKLIQNPYLERHIRIKHAKSFVCHICEKECPTEKTLQIHIERHLRMQKAKSFVCHVCEKECPSEKALQKHVEYWHGEEFSEEVLMKKKYKCHICPRRFTASWVLKTHIQAKHEEQFKCEVCKKLFFGPYSLIRHRSNVHGLNTEIKSAQTKSESTHEGSDIDEESEDYDDFPSTSLEVKIEEQDNEDQKPDINEFLIKKENEV